jgi:hypothetical protein
MSICTRRKHQKFVQDVSSTSKQDTLAAEVDRRRREQKLVAEADSRS